MLKVYPLILIVFILLFINTGCILSGKKSGNWQPVDRNAAPVVHEVKWKAETLSIIAKWYTGKSQNWEVLADANPNINPDSISIGSKIFIPSDLVKTGDPMTKQFMTTCYQSGEEKGRHSMSSSLASNRSAAISANCLKASLAAASTPLPPISVPRVAKLPKPKGEMSVSTSST